MVNPPRVPLRLPTHNYGGAGWYFVTTCTAYRRPILARTVGEELVLSHAGQIVADVWARTPLVDEGMAFGTFKSVSSREIRQQIPGVDRIWQRGFHDRVIRSNGELLRIREYILSNPARWIACQRSP